MNGQYVSASTSGGLKCIHPCSVEVVGEVTVVLLMPNACVVAVTDVPFFSFKMTDFSPIDSSPGLLNDSSYLTMNTIFTGETHCSNIHD